ncbi:MAG TPA: phage holin family protein [Polyangia bacterium]|nr:phage holin family protein [Polyangia bacterium]
MSRQAGHDAPEGVVGLLRETADGLGQLVADHIKLARLELAADMRSYGQGVAMLAIAGVVLLLGYAFAWLAVALTLARLWGAPIAFGAVAALHLIAGAIAVSTALKRMKGTRIMRDSAHEVSRSVDALTQPLEKHVS